MQPSLAFRLLILSLLTALILSACTVPAPLAQAAIPPPPVAEAESAPATTAPESQPLVLPDSGPRAASLPDL